MCRLAAYCGPKIPLERIIVLPEHSLLEQSQHANEAKLAVNGDGFGISWYDDGPFPGLYHDVLPAWSDGNLSSLCRMVKSRLFLAHVRASTVGETSRVNCHPFGFEKWSFMHNGQIADFGRIRRKLEASLPDDLYYARRGSTDSELFFLLVLANGLTEAPKLAVQKTLQQISEVQGEISAPNRLTCVFSDGEAVFAFRYASDEKSPTLYLSKTLDSGGCAIASEPLDATSSIWEVVEDGAFVTLKNGEFTFCKL